MLKVGRVPASWPGLASKGRSHGGAGEAPPRQRIRGEAVRRRMRQATPGARSRQTHTSGGTHASGEEWGPRAAAGSADALGRRWRVMPGRPLGARCGGRGESPAVLGIPVDFILFALTLLGVALFHHHTLRVAVTGLAMIIALQARLHRIQDGPRHRRASSSTCCTSGSSSPTCSACCSASRCCRSTSRTARCPAVLPQYLPRRLEGRRSCCWSWCSCCPPSSTTSPRR